MAHYFDIVVSRNGIKSQVTMADSDHCTFETKGYLTIGNALSSDELHALNAALNRKFSDRRDTFYSRTEQTYQSVRVLEVETAFDTLIMHPSNFDILNALMDRDIALSELSVIIKEPHAKAHTAWHKDADYKGARLTHSVLLISCMYYLTVVPPAGACFTVVPGSHRSNRDRPDVERLEDMPAHMKLNGKTGTAIIFNTNLWHAAMADHAGIQRRTVHIYYFHPWMKPTGHTKFPPRLLESADTPFLQKFYHTN